MSSGPIYLKPGLQIRLTRNLDKDRGFVNGAVGTIEDVLSPCVFTMRLSSGVMVLVHPIHAGGEQPFLPCTYGYATTIRRAQGSSLEQGALYFDHRYPAQRGYGYVGASRFKSSEGLYLYGKIRRTDWLPVDFGANKEDQEKRSALSESEDSEVGEFEDYEPSEDEPDEWDLEVEAAYEEAGDADWEDSEWKDLLKNARERENDLPDEADAYDTAGDNDWEDATWKELLNKGVKENKDLPSESEEENDPPNEADAYDAAGDNDWDEQMMTNKTLSEGEEDPPTMHKVAKAMMKGRSEMTDLPE